MHSLKEMRGKLQCFSKTGIKILPEKKEQTTQQTSSANSWHKNPPPVPTSTVTSQWEIARNLSLLEAKNDSSPYNQSISDEEWQ